MSVFDTIRDLRSFRSANDDRIPRKVMGRILEAGRQAPSPGNIQSVEFIVVEDEDKRRTLADAAGDQRFMEAPTSVIVMADVDRMSRKVGKDSAASASIAEASVTVQNMRLAAVEEDLSSAWITGFDKGMVSDVFEIPSEKKPMAIVAFCYASSEYDKPDKFGLNELTYYNMYDNQIRSQFDQLEWKGVREMRKSPNRKSKNLKEKMTDALQKYL